MRTRLLTTAEAAERRRKTPQALVMERQRGTGPPYIVDGGRVLYPEADLDAWLEARRVVPPDEVLPLSSRKRPGA